MVVFDLAPGNHTIVMTLSGYSTLTAVINVSTTGVVTCLNVTGGICGSSYAPGLVVSGTTVIGYLNSLSTVTPTPTSTPSGMICSWISLKGGASSLSASSVFEIEDAYVGLRDIGFTPTLSEVLGTEDFYVGLMESGKNLTGCNYT